MTREVPGKVGLLFEETGQTVSSESPLPSAWHDDFASKRLAPEEVQLVRSL
jgi:hypothetical protein